ncbi:peptidase [Sesbania bispinosa]|nr:peptidase [Sesbania bispinosa]
MDDLTIEYIIARWETFTAKLGPNQNSMIINREFYVHWINDILNREVRLRDHAGNMHICWVRNLQNVGFFTDGIMDSNSVEVQYPPLHNEPPAAVVPPPTNAAPNEQPAQNENLQHADVVGWEVIATTAFVSGVNPPHIPAHVVEIMFERRQRWLKLISDAGLRNRYELRVSVN